MLSQTEEIAPATGFAALAPRWAPPREVVRLRVVFLVFALVEVVLRPFVVRGAIPFRVSTFPLMYRFFRYQ